MAKLWHVYKIEVDGVLIYIGVTNDVENRRQQHMTRHWIPLAVGKIVVIETFKCRKAALKAEVAAIREHRPVGNFRGNPVGYKTTRDRDRALFGKLNDLEAARWRRLRAEIEAEI